MNVIMGVISNIRVLNGFDLLHWKKKEYLKINGERIQNPYTNIS